MSPPAPARRPAFATRLALIAVTVLAMWLLAAYIVLPPLWRHHERQPALAGRPMLTRTTQNIPGDPINVGLVGTKDEIIRAMARAGWQAADAITLLSSMRIGTSVALDRAYPTAPISTLLYDGKPQELAFEKASGTSAKRRHHVRFWRTLPAGEEGRPVWLGAASYDRGVGLSRYTGQITHHVGPDLDAERDLLIGDLTGARTLASIYHVAGIGPTTNGRNGGGDLFYTDGEVTVGALAPAGTTGSPTPPMLPDSAAVAAKNAIWTAATDVGRRLELLPTNAPAPTEAAPALAEPPSDATHEPAHGAP